MRTLCGDDNKSCLHSTVEEHLIFAVTGTSAAGRQISARRAIPDTITACCGVTANPAAIAVGYSVNLTWSASTAPLHCSLRAFAWRWT